MKKIMFIAAFLAMCCFVSSCAVKANKDDVVLVVQDVLTTENAATITFRNSDRVVVSSFKPCVSEGEVLLVKPDGKYLVLTKNNHLDFVVILMLVLFAFFFGCLLTGRYVRRCLDDDEFKVPEDLGSTSGSYFG